MHFRRLRLTHKRIQQGTHIHHRFLNGQRIGRKGLFLHLVNIHGHALRYRKNKGNADDTDTSRKSGQCGSSFLGKQIF